MPQRPRGTITIELVLSFPLLIITIWFGAVVAYGALAKAALEMTAMRAAREIAAGRLGQELPEGAIYRYGEFSETYGLQRSRVKMLLQKSNGIIEVGTCIRLPLPNVGRRSVAPDHRLSELVAQLPTNEEILQGARDMESLYADASSAYQDGKELVAATSGLFSRIKENVTNPQAEYYKLPTAKGLDEATRAECGPTILGGVVTAGSSFWVEKKAKANDFRMGLEVLGAGDLGRDTGNQKHLGESNKTVRIWARARQQTSCTVTVTYQSGLSKAKDLIRKATTTRGDVEWRISVPYSTTSGVDVPVNVQCDNGQRGTRVFEVVKPTAGGH